MLLQKLMARGNPFSLLEMVDLTVKELLLQQSSPLKKKKTGKILETKTLA